MDSLFGGGKKVFTRLFGHRRYDEWIKSSKILSYKISVNFACQHHHAHMLVWYVKCWTAHVFHCPGYFLGYSGHFLG